MAKNAFLIPRTLLFCAWPWALAATAGRGWGELGF